MIVAYVRDDADREVLAELAQRRLLTLARSACDAIALTRSAAEGGHGKHCCVLGLESLPGAAPGSMVVVRYDFGSASPADIAAISLLRELDVRDSLRTHDDLRTMLELWPNTWYGTATPAIIRALSSAVPPGWHDFWVTVVSNCAREVRDGAVSAALGVSERTLRTRLDALRAAGAALPSFPALNALIVAVNVLWWRERRGLHSEQAAERAGFSSARACSQYVSRHAGESIASMMRGGGFQRQVHVMNGWFSGV
jgi:hypothetical protein